MASFSSVKRRIERLISRSHGQNQDDIHNIIASKSEGDLDMMITNLSAMIVDERLKGCGFERIADDIEAELLAELEAELTAGAGQ